MRYAGEKGGIDWPNSQAPLDLTSEQKVTEELARLRERWLGLST